MTTKPKMMTTLQCDAEDSRTRSTVLDIRMQEAEDEGNTYGLGGGAGASRGLAGGHVEAGRHVGGGGGVVVCCC